MSDPRRDIRYAVHSQRWRVLLLAIVALAFVSCTSSTSDTSSASELTTVPESATDNPDDTTDGSDDVSETAQAAGSDQVFEWDLAGFLGAANPVTEAFVRMAEGLEAETDGRLVITVHPAGELPYNPQEYHRVVGDGNVEMADAAFITDIPAASVSGLPALVNNEAEHVAAQTALWPLIEQEMRDGYGILPLGYYHFPFLGVWGTGEPPTSLDDLDGMRIRTPSAEVASLVEILGAGPVVMVSGEVPQAVQQGTVDAVVTSAFGLSGEGWIELLDWGYLLDIAPTASYAIVNEEAFNGLPEDLRAALTEAVENLEENLRSEIPTQEAALRDAASTEFGMTIVTPTEDDSQALAEAMAPAWEQWAAERGDPGTEALSIVRDAVTD